MVTAKIKYIQLFSLLVLISIPSFLITAKDDARISQIRAEIAELKSQVNNLKGIRSYIQSKINEENSPTSEKIEIVQESASSDIPPQVFKVPSGDLESISSEEKLDGKNAISSQIAMPELNPNRDSILEQIDFINNVLHEDPEYWEIRENDDLDRLELAKQLKNSGDIDKIRSKLFEENEQLKRELAMAQVAAKENGDFSKADILQKQLEVKESTINDLNSYHEVCVFNEKDSSGQNSELIELKEKEKSAHKELVQENAKLHEMEKKIKEKQDSLWSKFGFGGPSEEEIAALNEQKSKTAIARKEYENLNKELIVKAANADSANDEIKSDSIDHGVKRLKAQFDVVDGKSRTLGLEEEEVDQKKAQHLAATASNPAGALIVEAKSSIDKELLGADFEREEKTMLKQAEILKKASADQRKIIESQKSEVKKAIASGEISKADGLRNIVMLENKARNANAVEAIAETVEESAIKNAQLEDKKSAFSGTSAVWNDGSPNTKTTLAAKPIKLAEAATSDAVTAVVDTVKNTSGGAFGETQTSVNNQLKEKNSAETTQTINALMSYRNSTASEKEEIRQWKVYGRSIKNQKAKETAEKLEKYYLSGAGEKGIDLVNAGHTPGDEKEAIQISLAKAKSNLDVTEKNIKESLKTAQIDYKTGKSTSLNPIKWGTGKLTKHESDKKIKYLEKIKIDKEKVENLLYDNQYDIADEKDKKYFMNTTSEGLKLKAELTKKNIKQRIAKIDRDIDKAFPGDERDKLRAEKNELINKSVASYKTYTQQSLHLEAEKEIIQDNYQKAKVKYRQIAIVDPAKAKQMNVLEKSLNEHITAKKNNENSAELAESVTTDLAIIVASGGVGKAAKGASKAVKGSSATFGKVKEGLKAYGKALNPIPQVDDIAIGTAIQLTSENIAKTSKLDPDTLNHMITAGRMVKSKLKSQRLKYDVSSIKPKESFDSNIMPEIRNAFTPDKVRQSFNAAKTNMNSVKVLGAKQRNSLRAESKKIDSKSLQKKKREIETALSSNNEKDILKLYENGGMKDMAKLERAGQLSKGQADQLNRVISSKVSKTVNTATYWTVSKTQKSTDVKIKQVMVGDSGSSVGVPGGRSIDTDADRTIIVEFESASLKKYADKHYSGNVDAAEKALQKQFTDSHKKSTQELLGKSNLTADDVGFEVYHGMGSDAGPSDSYPTGFVKTRQAVQGQTTVYNVKDDGRVKSFKTSGEAMTDYQAIKDSKAGKEGAFDDVKITPRDAEGMLVQQKNALKKDDCSAEKAAKALLRASKAGKILGKESVDPNLLSQARALRSNDPQAVYKSMSQAEQQEFVDRVRKTVNELSQ